MRWDDALITVGGLEFFGQARHRGSRRGFGIAGDGFTGWDDGVEPHGQSVKRPARPGVIVEPTFPGERRITIVGPAVADSQAELQHMGDQLTGLFSHGGLERMTVQHAGRAVSADVTLAAAPEFRPLYFKPRASYALRLVAPDPLKYGSKRVFTSTSQSATVFQRGAVPAGLKVTVLATSSMAGYGLRLLDSSGTNRGFLRFQALASGQRHVIDTTDPTPRTTAGALILRGLHSGQPFWLPPGGELMLRCEPLNGAARIERVEVTDSYL